MELKLRKVKRPSKGLVWYIVMWAITLISAFLAGYLIQETRKWKESSSYWFRLYEDVKENNPTSQHRLGLFFVALHEE